MSRTRYVFGDDKNLYPEGQFPPGVGPLNAQPSRYGSGPTILADYEPFVSPLDNTVVSGRKEYRAHCKKHNVVSTADLKGLPLKHAVSEYKPDRAAIREELKRQFYK